MIRSRSLAAFTVLALGLSPGLTAQTPLDRIPADADLVVRLTAPEKTIAKAAALADAVQQGRGDMVRQNAARLGQAIRVPQLAGVDKSRDWYVVIFAHAAGQPDLFFVIPTTNADQLTSALPERMTSRVEGDWVVYSGTTDQIPDAAKPGTGITSVMTEDSAVVFQRGDLSVFINVEHLKGVYEDKIASAKGQVDGMLKQFAAAATQANGMDMEAAMDMYRTMISGAFQALEDARDCSAAITVSAEGLQLEEYVAFADGSRTAKLVADQPTSAMPSLAKLPADAAGYFGMRGDLQQMIKWGWSMNARLLTDGEQQQEKFNEAMKQWQQIEFGEMVGSFQFGSAAEGLFQYSAIAHATPTAKIRALMREMTDLLGTIKTAGMTQQMTVQPDAETIGSHSIDLVTVKQEFDPKLDPTGMQSKMQKIMFGADGMVSRLAFFDGFYVQTMGGGREAMKTLLATLEGPPNADMAAHRAGLIAEPNLLMLGDLPKFAVSGLIAASQIPGLPIPIDADALSKLDLKPSYIGFSLAAETNALRAKTVIPTEQFRGILALVEYFRPAVKATP